MEYKVSLEKFKKKKLYSLGDNFTGENPSGEKLSFTNYFMEIDNKPFFGISGEFHFSRYHESLWEDEIIKMKMCGINTIATYVFWIHHEEFEGIFDFAGNKNVRKFIELCAKYELYVIIRIGPFAHGEARNGGIPDWMYGKPFEVRSLDERFLEYVKRFYSHIYQEIKGLFYKDGGPIIATQIDNEYMHSSAPWEMTTGISNEWIFGGNEGEAYMLKLHEIAKECGIVTPFYTCTGWGGAITPSSMMPLWGGYAYRPWLFYKERGEHPSTEEYVYQDYHNNNAVITSDFVPAYEPETRPYACCEMGGGMMCTYNYRFQFPYKSVDAMSNIKIGSGCNFLGYYVFHGGTNPIGKYGTYMNESQVPKLSYDYQAALGEFGQIRESYQRLKLIHFFCGTFGHELCKVSTVLPEGASYIDAKDLDTLRFAVRTDGEKGFLFINNFQDHEIAKDKKDENVSIMLKNEEIVFEHIDLAGEENCILPFHMDLDGIRLIKATAQPITRICNNGNITYVFLKPEGMQSVFTFEKDTNTDQNSNIWICDSEKSMEYFHVKNEKNKITVLCLCRELANRMYILKDQTLLFFDGAIIEDQEGIRMETQKAYNEILTYPINAFQPANNLQKKETENSIFDTWEIRIRKKELIPKITSTTARRYLIEIPDNFMEGVKDVLLQIDYQGDIGHAFLNNKMISDNFCNGATWEIGLRIHMEELKENAIVLVITPWKEGVNVNVESAMAARMESVESYIGTLNNISLCPVYECKLK